MWSDEKLDALEAKTSGLTTVLDQYRELLDNYRRLKSDYEEEKESREKYKRLARGQERNPFVLVLVDGDGYLFKHELLKLGHDGGVTAARRLSTAIGKQVVRLDKDLEDCRIMVRIYANLQGLSRACSRSGLCGNEARALSPFVTGFTRSQDLFDFIDAGEKKEGADYKLREMFRLFAENGQCKHIFWAGCHDTGYLSLLTPYKNRSDKVTLIGSTLELPDFMSLGLPLIELDTVFERSTLEASNGSTSTLGLDGHRGSSFAAPTKSNARSSSTQVCQHFLTTPGCKFGTKCRYVHLLRDGSAARPQDEPYARPKSQMKSQSEPFPPAASHKSSVYLSKEDTAGLTGPPLGRPIPLNKSGERLDTIVPKPSKEDEAAYWRRAKAHKVCNKHVLANSCPDPHCLYDHGHVDPGIVDVIRSLNRRYPCPRQGRCRRADCFLGHICVRIGCQGRSTGCRLTYNMHTMSPTVREWVAAEDAELDSSIGAQDEGDRSVGSPDSDDTNGVSTRFEDERLPELIL
ncbi:hypothetical protein P152DRAFT_471654 [Eremomyces bilateralis CBS 781.70]|uniref:C3H1-type domain-containing protein n=1 Tax=Eremomyces bilateralis CBS 781.70 TaxID=1392243 RepID=A0A6G1GAE7_9PEZI|nr:uncharacterized protein P152DRAFT_471654 [Eremomyces bilateralis CBS 781.70]KAF1815004.1 hypothetical protein P152DRAFT_471654 [Eremomyces bilateralis CBS 781.70]